MRVRIEVADHEFFVRLTKREGDWVADVDGERFPVRVDRSGAGAAVSAGDALHHVTLAGPFTARIDGRDVPFRILGLAGVAGAPDEGEGPQGSIKPPMTGKVEAVRVEVGQRVVRGDVLFILEAMKMRNEVRSPSDGVVAAIHMVPGATVYPGTPVLELQPDDGDRSGG